MSFDIQTLSLSEICTDISYGYTASANTEIVGPKFLRITDIQGGVVDWDTVPYCEIPESKLNKNLLSQGDIVVARTGNSTGENYMFSGDEPSVFASYLIRFKVDSNIANPHYVWLQMRTKRWWDFVSGAKSGSAQAGANATVLGKFEVTLPPKNVQDYVVDVISCLSSKISLNTSTNQTLEEMAQAIFKSWFVDFDPVKAKMNGEQPEGMDAATASLFPEKLVESELGLIPEGWKIQNTGDLFDVKDGTHDSPKKAEEGHYLVTSKHITGGKIDTSSAYLISDADFEKVNQRSKVDTFDILLTMIGTVGEVVVVYDNPVEFAIKNVGLFKTSQRPELVWLFYWHLQSFKMKNYLEVRMAGTTQQYLTLKTLRTIPVILPSEDLLTRFNEMMSPLMEKISDNHKQNHTLSSLRDTLLPKLLSGEIELAEKQEN